ncbi:hypothetical protein BDP27DRAFT_1313637 [Rhodocollybia butyracea]|uniref:Uncharacterized protein n=1 Tax=Rhodocollybia butyracea TaxID=206335 RepID=A0A9P5Q1K3_9AGAR|nr:hypothetical protein BDP27DRAFT_1313637 [Rhodocollybia butyracea]
MATTWATTLLNIAVIYQFIYALRLPPAKLITWPKLGVAWKHRSNKPGNANSGRDSYRQID